jgi:hypothetical protein
LRGELAARSVIELELVEILPAAGKHHDTGTGGYGDAGRGDQAGYDAHGNGFDLHGLRIQT